MLQARSDADDVRYYSSPAGWWWLLFLGVTYVGLSICNSVVLFVWSVGLSRKMLYKYFPPNLTHVTALPCETQIFSIVT